MKFYQTITHKYLLYILLFNTINCFTMESIDLNETDERINQQVEAIRDMLDEQLGINKYSCFRQLTGSIMSYYETSFLSQEQIDEKINSIKHCFTQYYATKNSPASIKKQIFLRLFNNHLYVRYLINACIQKEVQKFENITCSTLDQLLYPDFSNDTIGIKTFIYGKSREIFTNKSDINDPIKSCWHLIDRLECNDPHHIILETSHEILPNTMTMSKDKKYIQIKDINNNITTWNANNGNQITSIPYNINWLSSPQLISGRAVIHKDNYLAVAVEKSEGIILFKYPTIESHLCQELFNKNQTNLKQLEILNTSKTLNAIEGFPGKHIKQNINEQLNYVLFPAIK